MSETPQPPPPANGARHRALELFPSALCAEMPDLAPAFALAALDPDEAAAIERHRTICPACARLIEEAERTAAVLPYLARPATPAPDIRAALFTRIAQAQQAGFPAAPRAGLTSPPRPIATLPASLPRPDEARAARAARRRSRLPSLGALTGRGRPASPAAAVDRQGQPARGGWGNWPGPAIPIMTPTVPLILILAVVGSWAMTQYNRANERADEAATYQDLWGTIGTFLTAEDGIMFELRPGPQAPPSATGQVIAEPDSKEAILIVRGLDGGDDNVSYEVWVERDGTFTSAGDLDVDRRGNARQMIDLDARLRDCRAVVVMEKTLDASGKPVTVDVLSALITPEGPATGGDGTEGGQPVGSLGLDVVPLTANDQGR